MPDQPQSEEQFRRSYECLRRLFDYAGDAIFVHGLDGRFTDVNRAACEMLGYAREELLAGMFPWNLVVRDARETIQRHWAEVQSGAPITVTDELRRKDGTTFPAEVRLVRYDADDREVIIAICRDITKRRQAEEARARAEIAILEERNRMAREIHDTLAQSFTGILLQLEAADVAKEASKPTDSYFCRVRDLAKFGLAEARRSVLALRPVALEERGLEYALQQLAERSSIEGALSCEFLARARRDALSPTWSWAFSESRRKRWVTRSGMQNRRAFPSMSLGKDAVTLTVRDDGSGISLLGNGDANAGFGVAAMRERAREMKGSLELGPIPQGGTCLLVTVRDSDRKQSLG
ncbi:MAG: PAS domain S-box protein [Verrucomicrobiota bacterium]|nr:PAS domain S-box protein [Verrucomicrobiota bacterium]